LVIIVLLLVPEGRAHMAVTDADVHLNAKGMVCPMTVIKTKKALDAMQAGQVLEVVTTDRESDEELSAYANRAGH